MSDEKLGLEPKENSIFILIKTHTNLREEEPRDDYEFVSEDDMVNYLKKRNKIVVKREDLHLLINIILRNGFMEFEEKKEFERIKEEYKI